MRLRTRTIHALAFLGCFVAPSALVPDPAAAREGEDLGGSSVEVLTGGTATPLQVSAQPAAEGPVLRTEWVELAPDQRIEGLLRARGLEIDGGAYSLIYALNPDISDLSTLEAGSRLKLPVVRWPQGFAAPESLRLTVDRSLKSELRAEVEAIAGRSRELGEVPLSRFGTTERERSLVIESLGAIERDLRLIGTLVVHDLMIVDAGFLDDVTEQARLVSHILAKLTESGESLTALDASLLEDVRRDFAVRSAAFVETKGPGEPPGRYPAERVEVHTLSPDGQPVGNLRVFYVAPALCGRVPPNAFNVLSTPTTATINEADFVLWAGHTPDASLAVPHRAKVRRQRDGNPIRVDLLIEGATGADGSDANYKDPCGRN